MNVRDFVVSVLVVLSVACSPGRLIPLGEDVHGGGGGGSLASGGGVAGTGGGASSAGGGAAGGAAGGSAGGGSGGSGGGSAMQDAGPPPDVVLAAATCARIDACLLGANYGTASRYDWMSACVTILTQPRRTPAQYKEASQGTAFMLMIGTLPLPTMAWLFDPTMRSCVEGASSCGAVEACWNRGAAVTTCSAGGTASCNGTTLEVCAIPSASFAGSASSAEHTYSYDCSAMGLGCKQGGASAGLKTWGCGNGSCDPATYAPSCVGNVAHRCGAGLEGTLACPAGTTCGLVDAGGGIADARCVGPGPACSPLNFKNSCSGSQLTQCVEFHTSTADCLPGTTCQTGPDGVAFCGVAPDCALWGEAPHCLADGGLSVCALGQRVELGCGSLGFSSCSPATSDHAPKCQ